jgi:hypothetical protein
MVSTKGRSAVIRSFLWLAQGRPAVEKRRCQSISELPGPVEFLPFIIFINLGIEGRVASGKVGYFFAAAVFLRRFAHRFFISRDNCFPLSALRWPRF